MKVPNSLGFNLSPSVTEYFIKPNMKNRAAFINPRQEYFTE